MVSRTPEAEHLYDRFLEHLDWKKLLFKPGFPLQAGEMNEVQTMLAHKLEQVSDTLYRNGTILSGGTISTTPDGDDLVFSITAAKIYANGEVHDVPAGTCVLTGEGTEIVYLTLTENILNATSNPELNDEAVGAENFNKPGADRLTYTYGYAVNTSGIPIATFVDGVLVVAPDTGSSWWDKLLVLLALRTKETSGSYHAARPNIKISDPNDALDLDPSQLQMSVEGGVGYINGWRQTNSKITIPISRTLDSTARVEEPETFLTGTKVYNLDNPPVISMDEVHATIQSPTVNMTRGQIVNGQDPIPAEWQPTLAIVSVNQGGTTYDEGDDYTLAGNYIQWLPGATSPPDPGESYTAVFQYTKVLTKAVRTYTKITNESRTITAGAFTLAHTDVAQIISAVKASDATVYVEGTHFTVNKATGVFTWSGVANTTVVNVTYGYWAHTGGNSIEGDYVTRDSFRDSAGNSLPYLTPTKTPTGVTVDFKKQISFDVTGSPKVPVNNTIVYFSYQYALSREDLLVWKESGQIKLLEGTPALDPDSPVPGPDMMPIVKLRLPPDCFASDIKLEWANNLAMPVTEQRYVYGLVLDSMYNIGRLQLEAGAMNRPTATDKRGIFADDFSTPDLADVNHEDFAGTFDFLSRTFSLPRTRYEIVPTITSSDATLKEDYWFPNYTEVLLVEQPFASADVKVNTSSKPVKTEGVVTISPNKDTILTANNCEIRTVATSHSSSSSSQSAGSFSLSASTKSASISISKSSVKNYKFLKKVAPLTKNGRVFSDTNKRDEDSDVQKKLKNIKVKDEWIAATKRNVQGQQIFASASASASTSSASASAYAYSASESVYANVLGQCEVVTGGNDTVEQKTITCTGAHFNNAEACITARFDDQIVPLTATGATVQETDPLYNHGVRANSLGAWTATFQIPAGIGLGTHYVEFVGRNPSNHAEIWNVAEATYVADHEMKEQAKLITSCAKKSKKTKNCNNKKGMPIHALAHGLGLGDPSSKLIAAQTGAVSFAFAQAVAEGNQKSLSISASTASASFALSFSKTTASMSTSKTTATATAIANSCSVSSSSSVKIVNEIKHIPTAEVPKFITETTFEDIALKLVDPMAQVFRVDTDPFLSSFNLYFKKSTAASAPVAVSLVTLDDSGKPSEDVLATAHVAAASVHVNSTATNFTFENPVFVEPGKEYCLVVATNDANLNILYAVIGGKDSTTNALVVKGPAIGAMFESTPDGSDWQLKTNSMLKFQANRVSFTNTETVLSTGQVTFDTAVSSIAFNIPYEIPTDGMSVSFQYSLNNSEWFDLTPEIENDLTNAITSFYFRIKITHSEKMCPIVVNKPAVEGFIFQSPGAYVHREFSLNDEESRYVDVFLDTDLPGSTSITVFVSYDQEDWEELTEDTDYAIQIDDVWTERQFSYDTGGDLKQDVRVKVVLASDATYVSPRIRQLIVIAR